MNINLLPLEELSLSLRAFNCLRRAGIHTFGDMVEAYKEDRLKNVRNLGRKCVDEIAEKINEYLTVYRITDTNSELYKHIGEENYDEWVSSNTGKNFILTYLKENGIKTSVLKGISARAYNILVLGGKDDLFQVVFLERNHLMEIERMDALCANEIYYACREYINDNKFLFVTAFNEKNCEPQQQINSAFDVVYSPEYRKSVLEFIKANDISVSDWDISFRPKNQLKRNGFEYLSDIIFMQEDDFYRLPSMGALSVKEIMEKINEYLSENSGRIIAFCNGDVSSVITDDKISERIMSLYSESKFGGFIFDDFKERLVLPEGIGEERIKSVIGKLIAFGKLEYVDYRCYRRYEKFKDYLECYNDINEREREFILKRLDGETLESIGREYGLTRERVRQLVKKEFKKIKTCHRYESGIDCFDEDYYEYFYKTYSFDKADAEKWFGIGKDVFCYMEMLDIKQGKAELNNALEDAALDVGLKLKVKNYLNRNKLLLDGMWVEKKRAELEKYVLSKFCTEDVSFDDFVHIYNSFLESENVSYDGKIYYTDDVLRTRKNRLANSMFVLWKQSEQIRYYDIESRDYSELLDALNLGSYENIELSTLKLVNDYPEIMKKYDIRDQYELHNLLRKIVPEGSFHNFHFGRTPIIAFGNFDRSAAVVELIMNNAPISFNDLLDLIREEYGFESGTIHWNDFSEYYHQGIYKVDYKVMSGENKALLKEKLTDDFYYIDEIRDIYAELVPEADLSEINSYNLKLMGFGVLSRYAIQNYPSLDAYFTEILTKDDIVDITSYRKRFTYVQAFSAVLNSLKKNRTVFEFDPNQIINIRKLEATGITKNEIRAFCDRVYDFVEENTYFSIVSLRNEGFKDELYDLGFSDWFYANILAEDERFSYGQFFSNIILYKGNADVTIKNFEMWIVRSYGSIDAFDLMTELTDNYGCKVDEKSDVTYRLNGTGIYYDNILDRFYLSAEAYYRELEETEGI